MFNKLLSAFRLFGVVGGLIYLVDRLLCQFSSGSKLYYYELMVQPIHNTPILPESLSKSLNLKEIYRGIQIYCRCRVQLKLLIFDSTKEHAA